MHQKTKLGIGGRRVLVSRDWSGKTLADHRADAHAWVKALLGITSETDDAESDADERPAVAWEMARYDDPDLPALEHRLLRAISVRIQRRAQLNAARQRIGADPPDRSTVRPSRPERRLPDEEGDRSATAHRSAALVRR